jgi:hypothetical protein
MNLFCKNSPLVRQDDTLSKFSLTAFYRTGGTSTRGQDIILILALTSLILIATCGTDRKVTSSPSFHFDLKRQEKKICLLGLFS